MKPLFVIAASALLLGCSAKIDDTETSTSQSLENLPAFWLGVSEYPSWSTFRVAAETGLINPVEGGEHGSMEIMWGVDVVLFVADYQSCLAQYKLGMLDAVCATTVDSFKLASDRPSTAILPTSQSVGADVVIAHECKSVDELREHAVYGMSHTVSQYVFWRTLENNGCNPEEFKFFNLDQETAATAFQSGVNDVNAICVRNPFAVQSLRRIDSAAILDSRPLANEVIDQVLVASKLLREDPDAVNFAGCVCCVFYDICRSLNDPESGDSAIESLIVNSSEVPLDVGDLWLQHSVFYDSPDSGISLYESKEFQSAMKDVASNCERFGFVAAGELPSVGFGDSSKQLNFNSSHMRRTREETTFAQ